MDYLKSVLSSNKVDFKKNHKYIKMLMDLNNQKEMKHIGKVLLDDTKLEGDVSLLFLNGKRHEVIAHLGDQKIIKSFLDDVRALNQTKRNKRPYYEEYDDLKVPNYFMVLPIISKDEYLGALCIHQPQEIKTWEEIGILLYAMAPIYRYYYYIDAHNESGIKDVLTKLYNLRFFKHQLRLEIDKAVRFKRPFTLVIFQLENFNMINTRFDLEAGDAVVKELSNILMDNCRSHDMPARISENRFAVILTEVEYEDSKKFEYRLMNQFNAFRMNIDNKTLKFEISSSLFEYSIVNKLSDVEFFNKVLDVFKKKPIE